MGAIFPFLAVGLMLGIYALQIKMGAPADDPQNIAIQNGVIAGGVVSVLFALLISKEVTVEPLIYGGGAMAFLALISIGIDQGREAGRLKAAARSMWDAEEARGLAKDGDLKTAEEMLQEALLTSEIAHGSNHPQVAKIVLYLADLMRDMERDKAATVLYARAVGIHASFPEPTADYIEALYSYAEHLRQIEDLDQALTLTNRALTEGRKLSGVAALTGRCYLTQSQIQSAQGNTEEAYTSSQNASKLLEANLGRSHPDTLRAKGLVANHCVTLGRLAEAERLLREVLAGKEELGEDCDSVYLGLLLDLSAVQGKGRAENAKASLQKAIEIYRASVGPDYERAEELHARLPEYLAEGAGSELREFLVPLFAGESGPAGKALEANPELAKKADASGWTPLQWAAFFDQGELVRILLSQGADIEHGAGTDLPPLYIASRWGRRWVLTTMFRKDPNVEVETGDGSRPMHGAMRSGDQLTFDQLVSKKAKLDVPNKRGWTPLHEAAYVGDRRFLLELIAKGGDVNFQAPERNESPLHAAVLGGQRVSAEVLVLNMANVNAPDSDGVSPLQLAEKRNLKDILDLLKLHGDAVGGEAQGETPPAEGLES